MKTRWELVDVIPIEVGDGYEVQIITGPETTWVRLSDSQTAAPLGIWSQKPTEDVHATVEEIIADLRNRLGNSKSPQDFYDQLTFWPIGWDYWGRGTPALVSDYFIWGEFTRQLETRKAEFRIETFLAKHTEDINTYQHLFRLLTLLCPPLTTENGLACMLLLDLSEIEFENGQKITVENQGGEVTGKIANAVAVIFSPVNSDPVWWEKEYQKLGTTASICAIAKRFLGELKNSQSVSKVCSYLP